MKNPEGDRHVLREAGPRCALSVPVTDPTQRGWAKETFRISTRRLSPALLHAAAAALVLSLVLLPVGVFGNSGNQGAPGPTLRRAVYTLDADARTLQLAADAHFDTIVQLFSWSQIEPTAGQYHWQYPDEVVAGAAYYGLDLVVRLDRPPSWASHSSPDGSGPLDDAGVAAYASFVRAVASRYRDRVLGYIIWNEPNLALEWGGGRPDPAAYVALLQGAYRAVKRADPAALVVSAGLASTGDQNGEATDDRLYLEGMYRAGGGAYFDVLGAHPYGFAYPPDDPHGSHNGLNMARLADLRAIMVKNGDAGKAIWATEMGWTVKPDGPSGWQAVSEARQADYLAQAYATAGRQWPWLGMLAVWNLGGERGSQWDGYSLLETSGEPRPAYRALQQQFLGRALPAPPRAPRAALSPGGSQDGTSGSSRYQVLASDVVVHLGHKAYGEPWVPLYGALNPSSEWRGTFYVPDAGGDPGEGSWALTMRMMQSNTPGNYLWLNGRRLEPPLPAEDDFHNVWVSYSWSVPGGLLRSGPNEIKVTIGRALPLIQDTPFTFDDLQFKDITLQKR